jgi:hypothetical protein
MLSIVAQILMINKKSEGRDQVYDGGAGPPVGRQCSRSAFVVLVGRHIGRLFVRRAADGSEPDRSNRDLQRHRGELRALFRRRTRCVAAALLRFMDRSNFDGSASRVHNAIRATREPAHNRSAPPFACRRALEVQKATTRYRTNHLGNRISGREIALSDSSACRARDGVFGDVQWAYSDRA